MKRISVPKLDIDKLVTEFKDYLTSLKSNQTKISFEKKFEELSKINEETVIKPVIYFSQESWIKMHKLVEKCDKEIAWQATVEKRNYKDNPEKFYYYIKQVYVYPQKVTGTFVDTDEVQYAEWSLKLPDEVYNTLRFQGHSHVHMGVSPSGTDTNTYQNFLDQLNKDDFYIFMILNKRGDINIMVYDYAQDILFDNKDCYIDIATSEGPVSAWIEENMKKVVAKETQRPRILYEENSLFEYSGRETTGFVTYANDNFYMKNGKAYYFADALEAAEFFIDHPEFMKNIMDPGLRQLVVNLKNPPSKSKKENKKKNELK